MKKILFYSDVQQTGGHEIMAIEAIKALISHYDVYFIISIHNEDLFNRLNNIAGLHIYRLNYLSNRYQIIRNFFSSKAKTDIEKLVKNICPDLVVGIQGTIDSSFLIFPISKKNKIKSVSYIPIVFDLNKVSKNKLVGYLKDKIHHYYYNYPDIFITITDILANRIKHKCNTEKVYVVKNGVDFDKYIRTDKKESRAKHNIPVDKYVIGYIGRLEFWHKGLDYYIDFVSENAKKYPDVVFLFAGKGEAAGKIKNLGKSNPNILLLSWTNNVSEIFSSIDCYIQPSRFESGPGCPLTMLEALYFNLPVIASNIPEVSCFLPHENLFDVGNHEHISCKIRNAILGKVKEAYLLCSDFSIQSFRENFLHCITDVLENDV